LFQFQQKVWKELSELGVAATIYLDLMS